MARDCTMMALNYQSTRPDATGLISDQYSSNAVVINGESTKVSAMCIDSYLCKSHISTILRL